MTAKHRKGKGNQKNEDVFFKNEVVESEVRSGASSHVPLLVLFVMVVVGGAVGACSCLQQHLSLTHLTDNVAELQVKMAKLQASHEELRQSGGKHISEDLESRLNALEESYALAQKQVVMALATAEQLKTSDLPAQVLSLHTEMKARLAEMQQATVSLEQLSQLQTMLKGKSGEFEGVRAQVEGLSTLGAELSEKVEVLTGNLREVGSKLEERDEQVATLSTTLDGQVTDMLRLKEQLEDSTLEMAALRELLEQEWPQQLHQAGVDEQLDTVRQTLQDHSGLHSKLEAELENIQKQVTQLMDHTETLGEPLEQTDETPTDPRAAAASTEEETLDTDEKWEAEENEQAEGILLDEVPNNKEDAVTEEEEVDEIKEDQTEDDQSSPSSENTEVDTAQAEVEAPEEESEGQKLEESPLQEERHKLEEEISEMEKAERGDQPEEETTSEQEEVEEESPLKDESHKAEEEVLETEEEDEDNQQDGEMASEGGEVEEESLTEEDNHKAEDEVASDREEVEEPLLGEEPVEEEAAEWQEYQHSVAAAQEVHTENDSSAEDELSSGRGQSSSNVLDCEHWWPDQNLSGGHFVGPLQSSSRSCCQW